MQHGLKKSRGFVALWNSKERINLRFSMRSTLVLPNEILTHWNNSVVNASPVDAMFPNLPDNNLLKTRKCKHSYRMWCPYPKRFHAKKIKPKQFTPGEKTIIRFTREGVKVCSNFDEKYCHKFNPKTVLIHVGTRDIHNSNVKSEEFSDLRKLCTTVWSYSKIYLIPIIYRKDINALKVDQANAAIYAACRQYSDVIVADPFQPTEDMHHDYIHLKFRKGLPAIVKLSILLVWWKWSSSVHPGLSGSHRAVQWVSACELYQIREPSFIPWTPKQYAVVFSTSESAAGTLDSSPLPTLT